ncbi:MAG: hypothetical protein OEQ53_16335 [Saprospiraceae bacterium]|nr:hypothetical protein [Saprospiraceae bacterium]
MRAPNDYQQFRQKVDLMLDNALSQEARDEVMRTVNANPEYLALLKKERNFRDFVRNNVVRPKVTPEFIQSIKEKIKIN